LPSNPPSFPIPRFGTTSGYLRSGNFVDFPRKRHQQSCLVFFPVRFATRGSPVRSWPRPPSVSLLAKHVPDSSQPQSPSFAFNCARTRLLQHDCAPWSRQQNVSGTGAFSLARRLSISRASPLICNFIWEYLFNTCASSMDGIFFNSDQAECCKSCKASSVSAEATP
jgi:hypothetical protein